MLHFFRVQDVAGSEATGIHVFRVHLQVVDRIPEAVTFTPNLSRSYGPLLGLSEHHAMHFQA